MTNALDDTPHHAREKVERLHRQYSSWLQLNLGRTYGAQDAEDIVQETWMRLVPVAAATTIRHPKALLLRIAANLARDLAASRRVRKAYAQARGFSQREEPCQEADLGEGRSVWGLARMREPTSDTLELIRAAQVETRRLWAPGFRYAKAGVLFDDLVAPENAPRALLEPTDPRREALMDALDGINRRWGRGMLAPAGAGLRRSWFLEAEMRSPAYTTRLSEVPEARA